MGLLIECPKCGKRNSQKSDKCQCGFKIKKAAHKNYWIEYYIKNRRKRERIGPSKAAAEQRLRDVLKSRAEERFIKKDKNAKVTFEQLAKWYLELPQVKGKRSYDRDELSINTIRPFFSGKLVKELTLIFIEEYRQKRLEDKSVHKRLVKPATINREMACFRHMLNLAESEGLIDSIPFKGLKSLKENNVRNRILSPEEYEKLLSHCPPHTTHVVKMAYHTAMRQGEILNLTWDRIDLKVGVVRLRPEDTKTNEGRTIPLHREIMEMLKAMPRSINGRVFTMEGVPLGEIKRSFTTACKKAGIKNFTFHDLRHTCINNWRLQGHDFFRIMAASGHRTMEGFKRYNTVTEDELMKLVKEPMDTYMDTKTKKGVSRGRLTP